MKDFMRISVPIVAVVVLTACGSLAPIEYRNPSAHIPAGWNATPVQETLPEQRQEWWKSFNAPELDQIVAQVLAANPDMAVAALKVRQARLKADIAEGDLSPDLSASADGALSRALNNDRRITRSFTTRSEVSYEADLWNRLGDRRDGAEWEAVATQQDLESTKISTVSTAVTLYWQAVYYAQRIDLAKANIEGSQQTLRIVTAKQEAGAAIPLDTAEAEQSLETQKAALYQLEQKYIETLNALSILLDRPPGAVTVKGRKLPEGALPYPEAGIPSDILSGRPDIAASIFRLRKDVAQVNADKADMLPRLNLTGALGTGSTALLELLRNPVTTLGAGITLPFLNWNQGQRTINVSLNQYEQDVISYRKTLYQAFSDVENALSDGNALRKREESLGIALRRARQAEEIHTVQYREGFSDMQSLITAQEKRRAAEQGYVDNRLDRIVNIVTINKALGR